MVKAAALEETALNGRGAKTCGKLRGDSLEASK